MTLGAVSELDNSLRKETAAPSKVQPGSDM